MIDASPMNWSTSELAAALQPALLCAPASISGTASVAQVQTNSRSVRAGDLFVCLSGERFDAHDFAEDAVAQGALGLIVERPLDLDVPQWQVKDCRVALGLLAKAWRRKFSGPVLAVVGSNGKTTSKEMLACVVREMFKPGEVCVTEGNLNNEIGVPLTLLRLRSNYNAAVVEMGMNHPGEIHYLADLVQPNAVLLTNAQREHQEFMKTVHAVALENGAAFEHLQPNGLAVFPADTDFDADWTRQARGAKVVRFGRPGYVWLERQSGQTVIHLDEGTTLPLQPQFVGRHNLSNAAAVAALTWALGAQESQITQGLECFEPVAGRLQLVPCEQANLLIDDTYNANPDSVNSASEVLAEFSEPAILVLGDMGEVGDQSESYHREVGEHAKALGINRLFLFGEQTSFTQSAFGAGAEHFSDIHSLISALKQQLQTGRYNVLVKGSRFMKMERVVQALRSTVIQIGQEDTHAA